MASQLKDSTILVFAALPLLGACSETPDRMLCAKGALSTSQSVKVLANELRREGRVILALDVAVEKHALRLRDCEDVKNCLELDVAAHTGTSPANLLMQIMQPDITGKPMFSGVYLSQVNEVTDSTHYIELTQLMPVFPTQIDKGLCLDVSGSPR